MTTKIASHTDSPLADFKAPTIGFIGLGSLGEGLCNSLVRAGLQVCVNDLQRSAAERLCAAGASWSDDVAGACRDADVVITVLPSPAASLHSPPDLFLERSRSNWP